MSDEMKGEGSRQSGSAYVSLLRDEISRLRLEIERLKAGHFTPEEFQNLCHHFDETDREAFCKGCAEYQKKLFGQSDRDRGEKMVRALLNRAAFDEQEIDRLKGEHSEYRDLAKSASALTSKTIHVLLLEIERLRDPENERLRREIKAAKEHLLNHIPKTGSLVDQARDRLYRALDPSFPTPEK